MKELLHISSSVGIRYYTRASWKREDVIITGQWAYFDPYFHIVLDEDGKDDITGQKKLVRAFKVHGDAYGAEPEFNGFKLLKEKK